MPFALYTNELKSGSGNTYNTTLNTIAVLIL